MLNRVAGVLMLALALAACSAPAAPAPTTVPTDAPAPTAAAVAPTTAPTEAPTAAAEGTVAPTEAATAPAAAVTYAIVPEESRVSYEVGETFLNQNNRYAIAIGVTQIISGQIQLDRASPQNSSVGPIEIDISAFRSDSDRRDQAIRDNWLESATFPLATFVPTQIDGLPESYTDGQELTLTITGDLTIRETTRPVVFTVTGNVAGETMTGVATTQIKMSEFGFEPPNIAGILVAEDDVKIEFRFVARPTA